uniref:Fucolectin tachylectin-4 pentraxin-1 domain-containing protein n=1 Tax=Latimeria chalumnae TaxID=7897 RepID=H3APL5_LATCH
VPGHRGFYIIMVLLFEKLILCISEKNIALFAKVTQSSTVEKADLATDGNRVSPCSLTENQLSPWWMLDLHKPHKISAITVTNRNDSFSERVFGAEIRIGNSTLSNETEFNPKCGSITFTKAGYTQTYCCKGMEGRYVIIVIPERYRNLSLCEVEVYGVPEEFLCVSENSVSANGNATQSSGNDSNNAIDSIDSSTCSSTAFESNPWWKLEFSKTHAISRINITSKAGANLEGTEILIGNSLVNNGLGNPKCATVKNQTGRDLSFCCNGMKGFYVVILFPGNNVSLALCDVQVIGIPVP